MASNTQRAAVLARAIQASIEGDSSVIADLYTHDVLGWSPALTVTSTAQLAVEFEDRDEALSDITLECTPLDVGDDRACIEWVATATHTGPLLFDDETLIEATGKRITLRGVTVADFAGPKIRAFRQYWDEVAFLEQLELLPTD
jgi:ketosteroid isomerase-like protein